MAKAQKKVKPSLAPQRIHEDAWYYESLGTIQVIVWTKGFDGRRFATHVRIPWRKLMASAARCGRVVPKLSVLPHDSKEK